MRGNISATLADELLGASDSTAVIDPEEQAGIEARKKLIDDDLAERQIAKYKLEVMFGTRHTSQGSTAGIVTWWESGNKLHGGGDSKLYVCDSADPAFEGKGCKGFIPDSANGLQFLVCPKCGVLWRPQSVVGEIFYRLPITKWADVLLDWYQRLGMQVDIRIKYARQDIRKAQEREAERGLQGELLNKARSFEQRSSYIYPLKNIIKDTSTGGDLRKRILDFLRA